MLGLVIVSTFFLGLTFLILLIRWISFRRLTIEDVESWDYATFDQFHELFLINGLTREITGGPNKDEVVFTKRGTNANERIYISRRYIDFKGKGMVLYPLGYLRLLWMLRRDTSKRKRRLWKREIDSRYSGTWMG